MFRMNVCLTDIYIPRQYFGHVKEVKHLAIDNVRICLCVRVRARLGFHQPLLMHARGAADSPVVRTLVF